MKRARALDELSLKLLESSLLAFRKLPGSGETQAPKVVDILQAAGLKALHQSSPPGVAVYLQPECTAALDSLSSEHALCWLMCGLAPEQEALEVHFAKSVRRPLLAQRLAARLRALRPRAKEALDVALAPLERFSNPPDDEIATGAAVDLDEEARREERLEAAVRGVVVSAAAAMEVAELQIEREWQQLLAAHSSLSNACLALFLAATGVHLQDASLITSADRTRARLSLLLYDSTLHEAQQRPRRFVWLPSLTALLANSDVHALAASMAQRLWWEIRKTQGYYPPAQLVAALDAPFREWFASCLTRHGGVLALRAGLAPKSQLCFYLHGAAGSGKSSMVRALLPAVVSVVRASLHPECAGAFVKQGLNKPIEHLSLEFERRPNNNDLSVVTVLEMAREPLSSTEPRLMMLALEEMPSAAEMPSAEESSPVDPLPIKPRPPTKTPLTALPDDAPPSAQQACCSPQPAA